MADELANLRGEYNQQKEKLDEAISQISELKEQNNKLNDEIAELKAQIKMIDDKKFMKNPTESAGGSADSIPSFLPNKGSNKESNKLVAKIDAKRPNLLATCVPNWLVEVLAWIKRIEMADSFLPTSCRTFNQLCWLNLHGKNVKPHSAGPFTFFYHLDKLGNIHANIKHSKYVNFILDEDDPHCGYPFGFAIPVPCVPPPAYIHGFEHINFEFLDDELVEFIKGILHLMEYVNIVVDMEISKLNCGDKSVTLMNRLFDALRDKMLNIQFANGIENFCKIFPGFINQAQTLSLQNDIQNQSEKEISILVDWLANPWRNEHSKQKCLISPNENKFERDFIDRLINQFANASQAQVYIVCLGWNRQMHDEFTLENKQTGEVLALYYKIHPTYNEKFLMRYPKGEEQHWKELGENKSSFYWNQGWPLNTLFLDIKKFATNNI